uniref:Uncharacterized protein n=1 Tax=Chromera velia CCMP2878 TaxID=1169474 RepID=A0A0G4HFF3_9ALVE|eukprot:Cvel_26964.t1-p1 / transcript=Cvel_26964.t1 / gene=Cvel_26964 / organism=Chromera_velia_CCMP2878 / gene_product=hypothetical protein / transcript_product=hypothetical protein / location=Cvel_scaffold3288:3489-15183(-) / protein_length=1114 / sequence_SO=supercontig / SO=protein_coding / is_pseudo=false
MQPLLFLPHCHSQHEVTSLLLLIASSYFMDFRRNARDIGGPVKTNLLRFFEGASTDLLWFVLSLPSPPPFDSLFFSLGFHGRADLITAVETVDINLPSPQSPSLPFSLSCVESLDADEKALSLPEVEAVLCWVACLEGAAFGGRSDLLKRQLSRVGRKWGLLWRAEVWSWESGTASESDVLFRLAELAVRNCHTSILKLLEEECERFRMRASEGFRDKREFEGRLGGVGWRCYRGLLPLCCAMRRRAESCKGGEGGTESRPGEKNRVTSFWQEVEESSLFVWKPNDAEALDRLQTSIFLGLGGGGEYESVPGTGYDQRRVLLSALKRGERELASHLLSVRPPDEDEPTAWIWFLDPEGVDPEELEWLWRECEKKKYPFPFLPRRWTDPRGGLRGYSDLDGSVSRWIVEKKDYVYKLVTEETTEEEEEDSGSSLLQWVQSVRMCWEDYAVLVVENLDEKRNFKEVAEEISLQADRAARTRRIAEQKSTREAALAVASFAYAARRQKLDICEALLEHVPSLLECLRRGDTFLPARLFVSNLPLLDKVWNPSKCVMPLERPHPAYVFPYQLQLLPVEMKALERKEADKRVDAFLEDLWANEDETEGVKLLDFVAEKMKAETSFFYPSAKVAVRCSLPWGWDNEAINREVLAAEGWGLRSPHFVLCPMKPRLLRKILALASEQALKCEGRQRDAYLRDLQSQILRKGAENSYFHLPSMLLESRYARRLLWMGSSDFTVWRESFESAVGCFEVFTRWLVDGVGKKDVRRFHLLHHLSSKSVDKLEELVTVVERETVLGGGSEVETVFSRLSYVLSVWKWWKDPNERASWRMQKKKRQKKNRKEKARMKKRRFVDVHEGWDLIRSVRAFSWGALRDRAYDWSLDLLMCHIFFLVLFRFAFWVENTTSGWTIEPFCVFMLPCFLLSAFMYPWKVLGQSCRAVFRSVREKEVSWKWAKNVFLNCVELAKWEGAAGWVVMSACGLSSPSSKFFDLFFFFLLMVSSGLDLLIFVSLRLAVWLQLMSYVWILQMVKVSAVLSLVFFLVAFPYLEDFPGASPGGPLHAWGKRWEKKVLFAECRRLGHAVASVGSSIAWIWVSVCEFSWPAFSLAIIFLPLMASLAP